MVVKHKMTSRIDVMTGAFIIPYVPDNNFSVMPGFLTNAKQRIKCLAFVGQVQPPVTLNLQPFFQKLSAPPAEPPG